jgi:hypothetical protein
MPNTVRFGSKDIAYAPSIQARLIGQSFQNIPPHILGISFDYNVTLQRIDEYYESLDDHGNMAAKEWEKWDSFSPIEKEIFQHRIIVLQEQQQTLIHKQQQQGGSVGGGSRRMSIGMSDIAPAKITTAAKKPSPSSSSDTGSESRSDDDEEEVRDEGLSRWSKEEETQLFGARSQGMTWQEIWSKFFDGKRTKSAIIQYHNRLMRNMSRNKKKPLLSSTGQLSPVKRRGTQTTKHPRKTTNVGYRRRSCTPWTPAENQILARYWREVLKREKMEEICRHLPRRTPFAIYQRAKNWKKAGKPPVAMDDEASAVTTNDDAGTETLTDDGKDKDGESLVQEETLSAPSPGEQAPVVSARISQRFPSFAKKKQTV